MSGRLSDANSRRWLTVWFACSDCVSTVWLLLQIFVNLTDVWMVQLQFCTVSGRYSKNGGTKVIRCYLCKHCKSMLFRETKFCIRATKILNFLYFFNYRNLRDLHFCYCFLLRTAKCQYSNVSMLIHVSLCFERSEWTLHSWSQSIDRNRHSCLCSAIARGTLCNGEKKVFVKCGMWIIPATMWM